MSFFFFEALRAYFSTIYYECLVKMNMTSQVLAITILLTPLLLLFFKRANMIIILLLSGTFLIINYTYGKFDSEPSLYIIFHGMVVCSFGVFLSIFLKSYYTLVSENYRQYLFYGVMALTSALLIDFTSQYLGDTFNLTTFGWIDRNGEVIIHPLVFSLPLAIVALYTLIYTYTTLRAAFPDGLWLERTQKKREKHPVFSLGILLGIAFGLLVLLLGNPQVVVNWTPGNYTACILISVITLSIFIWGLTRVSGAKNTEKKKRIFFLCNLIGLAIQLFVFLDVLFFDTGLTPYILGIALCSIIISFSIFFQITAKTPCLRSIIGIIVVANLTFLTGFFLLAFCEYHIFLFEKAAFFRGKLPVVLLAAALFYLFGNFWYSLKWIKNWHPHKDGDSKILPKPHLFTRVALPSLILISGFALLSPSAQPLQSVDSFNVVSFNVHGGFDNSGKINPKAFLKTLLPLNPDIIALQESNTLRFYSSSTNLVYWLSKKLGMYFYFGSPSDELTPGNSLLSKFPIESTQNDPFTGKYLVRSFVQGVIHINETPVRLGAFHLAQYITDRYHQVKWIFDNFIKKYDEPMILMGDANTLEYEDFTKETKPPIKNDGWDDNRLKDHEKFNRDSQILELAQKDKFSGLKNWSEYLIDTWRYKHPNESGVSWEDQSVHLGLPHKDLEAPKKLDYIFVSPQFNILEAKIIHSPEAKKASDHYPLFVKLQLK